MGSIRAKLPLIFSHFFRKPLDMATPEDELLTNLTDELTAGDDANEANSAWHDERRLLAASEDLDLSGSLVNAFGETVQFTNIRTIFAANDNGITGEDLTVGGAAANQFDTWVGDPTDAVIIGPAGCMVLHSPIDGYGVTAAIADQLQIDGGANHITAKMLFWGIESAASLSASMSQSKSQSLSHSKFRSMSKSLSMSQSQSQSQSESQSKSQSQSQSQSMSVSKRSMAGSQSQSRSQSQSQSRSISKIP